MHCDESGDKRSTKRRNKGHRERGGIDLRKNQREERSGSKKAECRSRPADAGDDT